jgi:hypothetical protein
MELTMLKRLLEFLSLRIIIGTLPSQINNGAPIDATLVMADLNFIVSQVNANAAPAGSSGEWTSPGVSPTFISATQFSVPGDFTTVFNKRRRILLTVTGVNGGATVTNATFGAGNTTVTCSTDSAGFLAAGLTAVSYALLDSAILSTPRRTNVIVQTTTLGNNVTSGTGYWVGQGAPWPQDVVTNDIYGEITTGFFTCQKAGLYLCSVGGFYALNGATITLAADFSITVNGTSVPPQTVIDKPPNFTFTGGNVTALVNLAVADVVKGFVPAPSFTGGPMQERGGQFSVLQVLP